MGEHDLCQMFLTEVVFFRMPHPNLRENGWLFNELLSFLYPGYWNAAIILLFQTSNIVKVQQCGISKYAILDKRRNLSQLNFPQFLWIFSTVITWIPHLLFAVPTFCFLFLSSYHTNLQVFITINRITLQSWHAFVYKIHDNEYLHKLKK